VGKEDKVSKYVGDKDKQMGQTEASLDIQYMMGVSPGIKSEFWLWNSQDFCGDLANWTSAILADDASPLVHSISYGWQGALEQLHCEDAKIKVVDDNYAKLAAKGISIIFASGDSGSGYSPSDTQCMGAEGKPEEYTGTVIKNITAENVDECCMQSTNVKAVAWTFTPSSAPPPPARCPSLGMGIKGTPVSTTTEADAAACCAKAEAARVKNPEKQALWTFTPSTKDKGTCDLFDQFKIQHKAANSTSGIAEPPRPAPGQCTYYSKVTSTKPNPKLKSGLHAAPKVVLWPSWPASSPWITAVGSTRFVGQKVGAEQMATDQFGSGGGFSGMFNISDNAQWQADAVKAYLAAAPQLPPAASFPAFGRATPDVSALGEGYQVLQNGQVSSVGGTSASTPAFAGMIGLINDARLQAGKKPMGFLNPWIYKNTAAFTDIVKGNNAIGRGTFTLPYGFNCTKGWDPVTGVGTPIFDKMLAAAMK